MTRETAQKVIAEFIVGTPAWYAELLPQYRENSCLMCGIPPEKLMELREALLISPLLKENTY